MISIPDFLRLKPGDKIYGGKPAREWEVLHCYGSPENPSHTEHVSTREAGTGVAGPIFTRLDSFLSLAEARAEAEEGGHRG